MARDRVALSVPRATARRIALLATLALACGDDAGAPDAGPEAGADTGIGAARPAHLGAWFRCEDELCYLLGGDGFLLETDGTITELRAEADDAGTSDDAGVIGAADFSSWCEIPWGRYQYDGATLRIESDRPGEAPREVYFDVRGEFGTFFYEDLSHTHYWRVEGTSSGACPS